MYVSVQSTCHLVEASRALYTAYVIVTFGHTCKNMNEEGIQYYYKEKGSRHYFTLKKKTEGGKERPTHTHPKKIPYAAPGTHWHHYTGGRGAHYHTYIFTRVHQLGLCVPYSPALPRPAPPRPNGPAQPLL